MEKLSRENIRILKTAPARRKGSAFIVSGRNVLIANTGSPSQHRTRTIRRTLLSITQKQRRSVRRGIGIFVFNRYRSAGEFVSKWLCVEIAEAGEKQPTHRFGAIRNERSLALHPDYQAVVLQPPHRLSDRGPACAVKSLEFRLPGAAYLRDEDGRRSICCRMSS
jgi:hypothetical protein